MRSYFVCLCGSFCVLFSLLSCYDVTPSRSVRVGCSVCMYVTIWTHHKSNWQDSILLRPFPPRSWIYEVRKKRLTQFRTWCTGDNLCDTKSINAHLTMARVCVRARLCMVLLETELATTTTGPLLPQRHRRWRRRNKYVARKGKKVKQKSQVTTLSIKCNL